MATYGDVNDTLRVFGVVALGGTGCINNISADMIQKFVGLK
jgi:hypothetical protein